MEIRENISYQKLIPKQMKKAKIISFFLLYYQEYLKTIMRVIELRLMINAEKINTRKACTLFLELNSFIFQK